MSKYRLFVIFLCFLSGNVNSQDIKLERYTIDQGLSQNGVKCIYQDSKGYLWFGTEEGLNRYDGYTFTIYRPVPGDTTSISDNIINTINEDHLGNLWIGTFYGGLNKYNRETGKFKRYIHNDNNQGSIPENFVKGIYEDKDNILWGYNQYLYYYQPGTDNFKKQDLRFLNAPIYFFYEDNAHIFWIGTKTGLYKYNKKTGTAQRYQPKPGDKDSTTNSVLSIAEDPGGILWLGSGQGLYEFDKKTGRFVNHWQIIPRSTKNAVAYSEVSSLVSDPQYLWMAWESSDVNVGVSRFNKVTRTKTDYPFKEENLSVVHSNVPINIYKDRSGLIWVGTFLGGVIKFNKDRKFVSKMNGNTIGSFQEAKDGILWIGTLQKGLYRYDKATQTTINYSSDKTLPYHLRDNAITYLFEDHQRVLWVGTYYGGLHRLSFIKNDLSKPRFEHVMDGPIKAIVEDLQHRLYIGSTNGFTLLNPVDKKMTCFQHKPNNRNSISDNSVQIAASDSLSGDLWIGTWNGLNRMILPKNQPVTTDNVKFVSLKCEYKNKNSIGDNRVISLCVAKNGVLWAGTFGGGLNRIVFNRSSSTVNTGYKIKRYTIEDGLPSNVVYGIIEDSHGNLWLSTNWGLSKFNPVKEDFVNYDVNDGLQSNEFFWRSYYKGPSGKAYFGGTNGYNTFFPDSVKVNTYVPPVYITGFYIFNKLQVPGAPNSPLKKQINEEKEITIHYNQSSVISFEYVALNYISSQKNMYAYKLEGFDNDWQYVGSQRKATYTNLDPGKYTFRVIASNNDNLWNRDGASINLIIVPPFWKTLWFRALLIIIFLSSVVGIYYWRMAQTEKANILLKKMVSERTKTLELRTREVEEKNSRLLQQAEELNSINALLEERQQQVEEQSEELTVQRDQLGQLNATKDKLFSILAHDLRNPFHVIIGFSELIMADFKKLREDKILKFLDLINSSSKRGNDLLENILQWSRAQTGRISFEPKEQSLSKIVEEVKSMLEGGAQQKNITINQLIGPEIVVIADENMLKTIFRNLISNAIKFTPEKGSITLNALISLNAAYVEVAVSDTGVGIPETTLKNLFRIDSTITTRGTSQETGTGLGLIICKEFVERNKGKIWVNSEISKGTTFYFTLPSSPELL